MTHHITADHLVDVSSKAVMEKLFRQFNKALQSFCNEEQDCIAIFCTLRYTRIRLHVMRKYLAIEDALIRNTHDRFLDIVVGYINTELDLLRRYDRLPESTQSENLHHGTGTLVELVELVFGLQETRRIDDGETTINELSAFFGQLFGMKIKDRHCYNA